jgi:hypothetical protein
MNHSLALACAGALLAWSPTLSAAEDEEDEDTTTPGADNRWSLGFGVGLSGAWLGGGPGDASGGLAAMPLYSGSIEYRASHALWLMLRGSGNYSRQGDASSTSVSGSFGLRGVVNPDDAFQVSFYGMAGASYGRGDYPAFIEGLDAELTSEVASIGGHIASGLALEQIFTDHFRLRFATSVLRARYDVWSDSTLDGSGAEVSSYTDRSLSAEVGFEPEIQLRLAW